MVRPVTAWSGLALVAVGLFGAAGCGSDDDSSKSATKPAEQAAPKELLGSYTTKLKPSDLPSNPPEELSGSTRWTLRIANSGGQNNGPAFTIADAGNNTLESSSFGVRDARILLHREECAAGGTQRLYENEYRYQLRGKTLTFTTVKNSCSDKVAETILTGEPWTKAH